MCANSEVEERPDLIRRDGMNDPGEWHDANAKHQYEQCPSFSLPVERGETRQDRGILDAFLGAYFDLTHERARTLQTLIWCGLEAPGPDDPGPAVTPQEALQHTDHVNLLPSGPPSTLAWQLISSLRAVASVWGRGPSLRIADCHEGAHGNPWCPIVGSLVG